MFEDFLSSLAFFFKGISTPVKEGHLIIAYAGVGVVVGLLVAMLLRSWIVFWLGLIAFGFCLYFFRDPMRYAPFAPDEIASPADGHVLSIKTENDPEVLVVRIFLSIMDVHIQRATINGKIGEQAYHHGTFAFANAGQAADNERNFIPITGENGRYAHVEQITGAIARRIVSWVKKDQPVRIGAKLGLIYFGSQVAVYLPARSVRVLVHEGQPVQGGISTIALWTDSPKPDEVACGEPAKP
ncbi:MAG: phosphatidylserine decarboxylase [Elusimicrobiaceae bacterium]|nr:phosphatidylserine decarboxylase [Elusimicrobiaceae bacterium]